MGEVKVRLLLAWEPCVPLAGEGRKPTLHDFVHYSLISAPFFVILFRIRSYDDTLHVYISCLDKFASESVKIDRQKRCPTGR